MYFFGTLRLLLSWKAINRTEDPRLYDSPSVSRIGQHSNVQWNVSTSWVFLLLPQENVAVFWVERYTLAVDIHIYMLVPFYGKARGYGHWYKHIFLTSLLSLKSDLIWSFSWTWKTALLSHSVIYATTYWRMNSPRFTSRTKGTGCIQIRCNNNDFTRILLHKLFLPWLYPF